MSPTPTSAAQRAVDLAAARTLRDLRRSVALGRAMSLPNFLRLFRRRASDVTASDIQIERHLLRLDRLYRAAQPLVSRRTIRAR